MFRLSRFILPFTRVFLFGMIVLAIVLWFLNIIPVTYQTRDLKKSKVNKDDVTKELIITKEIISDEISQSDVESVVSYDELRISEDTEHDFSYENINKDTMVFACAILRHGNTSSHIHGKPLGIDGVQQIYEAGQFLRRRYNKLLGNHGYSNDKIYMLSTDTDRAIMSAQVHLAAMFPPTDESRLSDKIWWHPIPLHTLPREMDIFFRGGKPCPKYKMRYDYYMKESPHARRIWKKYKHLIRYWEEMSGRDLSTMEDIAKLYRKLISRKAKSQLENWGEEALEPGGPMEYMKNVVTELRGTPELVRRRVGFLIKEILQHCAKKIDGTLHPDRVLYLYSAHSSTILPILNGFGIYELEMPPFASSLHFEVYKNDQDEHYLQFFYRKPDEEHPLPLNIPGCGENWTLEQFYSEHGELIPGDFESECNL